MIAKFDLHWNYAFSMCVSEIFWSIRLSPSYLQIYSPIYAANEIKNKQYYYYNLTVKNNHEITAEVMHNECGGNNTSREITTLRDTETTAEYKENSENLSLTTQD